MTSLPRLRLYTLACILSILFFNAFSLFQNLPRALAGETDFRTLYVAGAMLRTGHATNLYQYDLERTAQNTLVSPRPGANPFFYPPYAALPFVPLSALPYRTAYFTFLAVNLLLLFASARLLHPYLPSLIVLSPAIPSLIFLAFFPVTVVFYQGQVSLIFLLLFCAAYASLEHHRAFLAGLLLSVVLIKLQLVLPVVLLFLFWRVWRFAFGFAVGAAGLTLLSLAIQGPRGLGVYVRTLLSATSNGAIGTQNPDAVFPGKMANLHGLWFLLFGTSHWTTLLILLTSAAVLLWTSRQPPSLPRATVAALLVSYHLHVHDLTLLLLPISLTFNQALNAYQAETRQPNRFRTAASLLWMTSPPTLYLIAIGANGLFAPAMLPFLLL